MADYLIAAVVAIFALSAPFVNGNYCANQTSSTTTYIPNPTLCSGWVACQSSKIVNSGDCGPNKVFTSGSCQTASATNACPTTAILNICSGKNGTAVIDPGNCHDYYYCLNGAGFVGTCATDTMFNSTLQTCVSNPGDVCPTASTGASNLCTNMAPGMFVASTTSCYDYYYCSASGIAVAGTCGPSNFFNPTTSTCVYSSDYTCPIPGGGVTTSTAAPVVSAAIDPATACVGTTATEQFAKVPNSCTDYYYCANGASSTSVEQETCPNNLYFNGTSCVAPANFACTPPPCTSQTSGKFVSNPASCAGYFYCDGATAQAGTCPSGYYFDSALQNCNAEADVVCTIPKTATTADGSTDTTTDASESTTKA